MINNDEELESALSMLELFWSDEEGTIEFEMRQKLIVDILEYEDKHCHIPEPTPEEADRFRADQER